MKTITTLMISCFILFSLTNVEEGREIKKDFHESFKVQKGYKLHLKHEDGDVTIIPWDKDVVDVKVKYRVEFKSLGIGGKLDFDVEFKESGGVIHVIGKEEHFQTTGFGNFRKYEHTYKIYAPPYLELKLQGDDGNVDIKDWQGKINCELDDGNIKLQDITSPSTRISAEDGNVYITNLQGDLHIDGDDGDVIINKCKIPKCRLETEDGNITIKRCEGVFKINVDDGDVELDKVRTEKLDIRAVDGSIELDLLKVSEIDLDIRTDDGKVTVDLERGISADISINTSDGRIRTDLRDCENSKKGDNWFSGEIHGGKGRIRIRTNDGNVVLRESR